MTDTQDAIQQIAGAPDRGSAGARTLYDAGTAPTAIDRLLDRHRPPAYAPAPRSVRHQRIALLTRAIETQIIPKLVIDHGHGTAAATVQTAVASGQTVALTDTELAALTQLVLANDTGEILSRIERLRADGTSLAEVCVSLLTPVARRLGELWDDDLCSFIDVTAGLGTLQLLLHRLHETFLPAIPVGSASHHVLLASLPGEQHTFGLQMVAELFRDSGWNVTVEFARREADLVDLVRAAPFAIAGLSIATDNETIALASAIRAIRAASVHQAIGIMVGGPVFVSRPELARLVGADVTACNAEQAVFRAEGLRALMATLTTANIDSLAR